MAGALHHRSFAHNVYHSRQDTNHIRPCRASMTTVIRRSDRASKTTLCQGCVMPCPSRAGMTAVIRRSRGTSEVTQLQYDGMTHNPFNDPPERKRFLATFATRKIIIIKATPRRNFADAAIARLLQNTSLIQKGSWHCMGINL